MDERPWLRPHTVTPAALQGKTRMRPLIYVYDLPAEFNSRMLQYRLNKWHCVWRLFMEGNISVASPWTYAIETAFHEALLQVCHMRPFLGPSC